jgi:zinc transport system substrate-binding protein
MVFHPAFGYFGDAYGLKQVPVEIEGKEPSAQQLAALVRLARERDIKIIFVQPQFSDKSARAVAQAIGGAVLAMDDLGPDYLKNMTDIAEKIEKALAKP